ncbi:MAG: transcriptional regulator [Blastocatellales bacterium]
MEFYEQITPLDGNPVVGYIPRRSGLDFFWISVDCDKVDEYGGLTVSHQLQKTREIYRFSVFRLDVQERCLRAGEERISLTPKQFDLLTYFVEHAGRVMKKSELLDAVWADAYVEETTLARNVSWLRKTIGEYADGESYVETVAKIGYRFKAKVTRSDENALIVEEQTVPYSRGEETLTLDGATAADEAEETDNEEAEKTNSFSQNIPSSRRPLYALAFLFIGLPFVALGMYSSLYRSDSKAIAQPVNEIKVQPGASMNVSADGYNQRGISEKAMLKVGSIVSLRNQYSNDAGYLDAWGLVRNKPEFSIVPTETMFVSTHPNPNRDNGSGSWEIVSAAGKRDGEMLVYGDKIHLRNMYPGAGYLDNCGWIKDMPVYKDFVKVEKFAVFTTYSEDRDNGTGTWIVSSDNKFDGNPVLEGDGIVLENGLPGGGFLDTAGRVNDLPAFNDYDGSLLVFIHKASTSRRPNSGIWVISGSKATLK